LDAAGGGGRAAAAQQEPVRSTATSKLAGTVSLATYTPAASVPVSREITADGNRLAGIGVGNVNCKIA